MTKIIDTERKEIKNGRSIIAGSIVGFAMWGFGYTLTYLLVAPDLRESPLHRFIEAFEGTPTTYEMVGWVFFNAHMVNTVFRNVPVIGSHTTSHVGGEDGFTVLLFAIPVALLLIAGFILARYHGATDPTQGLFAGLLAVPGYALLSLVGAFLFEVTLAGASGAPDLLPAVFLAGLVYPVLFAGGGGAIEGFITRGSLKTVK